MKFRNLYALGPFPTFTATNEEMKETATFYCLVLYLIPSNTASNEKSQSFSGSDTNTAGDFSFSSPKGKAVESRKIM